MTPLAKSKSANILIQMMLSIYTCHHQSWPYMCGVGSRKQQRVLLVVSLWCLVASAMASLPKIEEEEGGVLLRAGAATYILHLMIDEPIYMGLFTSTLTGYGRHTTSKDCVSSSLTYIVKKSKKANTGRKKKMDRSTSGAVHACTTCCLTTTGPWFPFIHSSNLKMS